MQHKPFIINDLGRCVLRQFCAKFGAKRRYLKKITIDNQQVTDGGRVLLNPASATTNGRNSFIQRNFDHNSFMGVAETRTVLQTFC